MGVKLNPCQHPSGLKPAGHPKSETELPSLGPHIKKTLILKEPWTH
jgi:hypothetical protein